MIFIVLTVEIKSKINGIINCLIIYLTEQNKQGDEKMATYCKKCGNIITEDEKFCGQCGEKKEDIGYGNQNISQSEVGVNQENKIKALAKFSWKWMFISILIIGVMQFVFGLVLGILIGSEVIEASILWLAVSNLTSSFIGAATSAYLSPGITIKEPAIALAVLAVISSVVINSEMSNGLNFIGIIISILIFYTIGILGAKLGEKIQNKK